MPREMGERQLLDAAVAGFARYGYQAASMDDIAEEAGVSKALVHLYLKSKEDLFTACIRRERAALVTAVRAGTGKGEQRELGEVKGGRAADAEQQLWTGLCAFFEHTAVRPDGWSVLHRADSQGEPFAREIAAMRAEITELVTLLLSRAAVDAGCDEKFAEREISGLVHAVSDGRGEQHRSLELRAGGELFTPATAPVSARQRAKVHVPWTM
jgi:AcrR family transcriptional regulator